MVDAGSVREFIKVIFARPSDPGTIKVYRGLSDHDYNLIPSIFRKDINQAQEHILLRELIAAHPDEFATDQTALEQLVRMQHYALPTRLLDVSFNPLVALFFASQEDRKKRVVIRGGKRESRIGEVSGDVVVFSVNRERIKYFDSDTVSCVANLARLSWDHKQDIDTSLAQADFNMQLAVRRLLHFIRQEKYQFDPDIVPTHLTDIFLVRPKLNNKRILAQNGAFFIFGLSKEIEEPNTFGIRVERIRISSRSKRRIRDELDKLNLNEKTLFPEIERAARYLSANLQDGLVSAIISSS